MKYRVISVSLYPEDIERIERCVELLRKRDGYKWSRSELIRLMVRHLDATKVPERKQR